MKDLSIIIEAIKETSKRLNEAKQDNPLITLEQRAKNISHLETKLSTLLFCADLDELNKHIFGLQLGFN